MDRYYAEIKKGVATIIDSSPAVKYHNEVCTVYTKTSALHPSKLVEILNKFDRIEKLPRSATKKDILQIINL
ncbi:MAG: hypothetical protein PHZ24_09055 [Bacteroidales bacterium]|nr:hypothetical protein [Bacteroidales bacterium]